MVDLADALRVVAVVLEVLGQGDDVRVDGAEVGVVPVDPDGIGAEPGHDRSAGRAAERLLAVGAVEADTRGGQAVDVGAEDMAGAVAPEVRPQVIDGDEKDVGALCGRRHRHEQRENKGRDPLHRCGQHSPPGPRVAPAGVVGSAYRLSRVGSGW